jgi:hypothetical protein
MKNPISHQDFFFEHQIGRIVEEQMKTNELLQKFLDVLNPKPPVKEVDQVVTVRNVGTDKRKRR